MFILFLKKMNNNFITNKIKILENQISEINKWFVNTDHLDKVRVGVLTIGQQINEIFERLNTIDKGLNYRNNSENFLTADHREEIDDELKRIETLLDNLVKEVLGPDSLITYNEEEAKYIINDGNKTLFECINLLFKKIDTLEKEINNLKEQIQNQNQNQINE
jgi:predicted  nucleic acid-binding Zn-ribbon protein